METEKKTMAIQYDTPLTSKESPFDNQVVYKCGINNLTIHKSKIKFKSFNGVHASTPLHLHGVFSSGVLRCLV